MTDNKQDKDIRYFKDEDGNKVGFEAVAEIYLDEDTPKETKYLILSPLNADDTQDDAYIFRVDEVNGQEELNFVEDDDVFARVSKAYKELLYNNEGR